MSASTTYTLSINISSRLVSQYTTISADGKSQVHRCLLTKFLLLCIEFLAVLILFDCGITLSQEVDVIWARKWNATTWLYVLTRYSTVVNTIILLIPAWNFVVSQVHYALCHTPINLCIVVEVDSCVP